MLPRLLVTPLLLSAITLALLALAAASPAAEPTPAVFDLNSVIGLALERSPVVIGAESVVEQRQGQRVAAGAYPNPIVSANSGQGVLRDAGRVAANATELQAKERLTEYNGTVGQPLEWPAKRSARIQAAAAGQAGASAGLVETRLNLTAEVKVGFFQLLFAQRSAELAQQNLKIVEDVRRIVNTRVRLGEAPQFEAIKAQVEVLKANQVVTRAQNVVRVNRVILNSLTAGALGTEYTIQGEFEQFAKDLNIDTLIRRAVQEHPAIQRYSKQVERADYTLEFERQARVPNMTFNGSYVREIGREAWLAGVSVPTPIWYQQQGEIATALGSKRREEAALLQTRFDLSRAVSQHFQDARTTAELLEVFEKGLLKQSDEALRIAQFSFQQGAASLLEVLDAQRVQRQILQDYAQAQFDLSVSLARLEQAVGGML